MLANITKQHIVTTLGRFNAQDEDEDAHNGQVCLHRAPYFIRMRGAEPAVLEDRLKDEWLEQRKKWKRLLKPDALNTMHITLITEEDKIIAEYDGLKFCVWPTRVPHLFVPEVLEALGVLNND